MVSFVNAILLEGSLEPGWTMGMSHESETLSVMFSPPWFLKRQKTEAWQEGGGRKEERQE